MTDPEHATTVYCVKRLIENHEYDSATQGRVQIELVDQGFPPVRAHQMVLDALMAGELYEPVDNRLRPVEM